MRAETVLLAVLDRSRVETHRASLIPWVDESAALCGGRLGGVRAMEEPSLLLVDEDARRRRALEVGLRRAGFRVTVAGSAEQALWFLDHALPKAIICAARLAEGMSSLTLAELVRAREELSSIVLVMIDDDGACREALVLADDVVGAQVTVASLSLRLRQALFHRRVEEFVLSPEGTPRALSGTFDDLTPIDLLRLVERVHCSGMLGVETRSGPATLWFSDGRVIDGTLGRFEGEEAVFRLLMAVEGSFELTMTTHA
ncbi:MAG TPA: DUF4388 domain-containing protein, partial [Nannocystis exedens]|nr:DUF4388 domain-containing protein [Nannocystis exedens]